MSQGILGCLRTVLKVYWECIEVSWGIAGCFRYSGCHRGYWGVLGVYCMVLGRYGEAS